MRFVSFNANSIRARLHQLAAIVDRHNPDVLAIQETKVEDASFPIEDVQALGFEHVIAHGQKTHYGVALLSRLPPSDAQRGFPWRDADEQRRLVVARYPMGKRSVRVINGYFPQGEKRSHPLKFPAKARFYADLQRYLAEHCDPAEPLILAGDMNVAPEDLDIGIGEDNRKRWLREGKTSFLPEERAWLGELMAWGLVDAYAQRTPTEERRYSWFDYRSKGFERTPRRGLRIDLALATPDLAETVTACGIDYEIRAGERPSDHCPIWCHFDPKM